MDSFKNTVKERIVDFRNFDFKICDPEVYLKRVIESNRKISN